MKKAVPFIGFSIFLIIGVTIGVTKMFTPELDAQGHNVVMMLMIVFGLWIFKPLNIPSAASAGLFAASLLAFGVAPSVTFAGFSGNTVWVLIPALFFGYVLAKTGLGRRIAYFVLKSVKLTYPRMLLLWLIIGVALSILTPSMVVRVIIVIPIALQVVQLCQLPEGSKGRSLILITAWFMAIIPGLCWPNGSLNGPILMGFYSSVPDLVPFDFASWTQVSFLPVGLIVLLTVIGAYFVLKPSEKLTVSKATFVEEYQKLGKMSRDEIITAIVLVAAFLLFVSESIHHIPAAATCLCSLFALVAAGVVKASEFSSGISWDLVIFQGTATGLGTIFAATGISAWLSSIFMKIIAPLTVSPWVLVFVVLIAMFIWRFVDIAIFVPTMAIVTAIAPEMFASFGINPYLWIPLLNIAFGSFFLSYTNMFALAAETNMAGKGWASKHLTTYGVVYFVASLITMLVAIPYWVSIGMFG